MAIRNVSLTPRAENVRSIVPVVSPVVFELNEILRHFNESLDSIKNQFDIADELISSGEEEKAKTIYRSQIVFLEGILDFYMHEITKYGLYKIFLGDWGKTDRYKNFTVPMSELEKAISFPESKKWFFAYVNEIFASVVMQDWETIKDQLNLVGIEWKVVCKALYPELDEKHAIDQCKYKLASLYKRRNVIAHQNDRDHSFAIQNDITKEYVETQICEIESFVTCVHNIAQQL